MAALMPSECPLFQLKLKSGVIEAESTCIKRSIGLGVEIVYIKKNFHSWFTHFHLIINTNQMLRVANTNIRWYFSIAPKYKEKLEKYYRKNILLAGQCSPQGSQRYSKRNQSVHLENWRSVKGVDKNLKVSTLGLGTYNGPPSNDYDYQMFRAIVDTILSGGVNVIDTCPLYRYGKSQKVINAALNYLIQQRDYKREEFLVSTKCGYIPQEVDSNLKEQDFINILSSEGIVSKQEIVNNVHCVHPNFIDFSIQKSKIALGLEKIDIVYLNNFSQAHLPIVGEEKTYDRLRQAFVKFEEMRTQNRIGYYGLCSYVGLRSPKNQTGVHFQLQKAIKIAKQIGGVNHGFRFLMVPFSLGTPEILLKWQQYEHENISTDITIFEMAERENINMVGCSPLFQGKVANLPFSNKKMDYLKHNSAKHLQLMRSFYSPSLLTTLVGQTESSHIDNNLSLLEFPRLTTQEWRQILPLQQ